MYIMAAEDRQLLQKEAELKKVLVDFYSFDLSDLRRDLSTLVKTEADRITTEKDQKIKELQNNFKRIVGLKQDFVVDPKQTSPPPHLLQEFKK